MGTVTYLPVIAADAAPVRELCAAIVADAMTPGELLGVLTGPDPDSWLLAHSTPDGVRDFCAGLMALPAHTGAACARLLPSPLP
jgi:hypothetical protein